MWGEPVPIGSLNISEAQKRYTSPTDVIVDAPIGKTLFDDCEWRNFMSRRYFYIILTHTASKKWLVVHFNQCRKQVTLKSDNSFDSI